MLYSNLKNQNKMILVAFGLGMLLVTNSCSQGESYLSASIQTLPYYIMPSETKACKTKVADLTSDTPAANDVSEKFVQFKNISLSYSRSGYTFELLRIDVKFNNSNASFTCVTSGDELSFLTFDSTNSSSTSTPWNAILDPSATTGYAPGGAVSFKCPITCGGITTASTSFVSYGTIQFIGIETETSSGDQKPVKLVESIGIENIDTD